MLHTGVINNYIIDRFVITCDIFCIHSYLTQCFICFIIYLIIKALIGTAHINPSCHSRYAIWPQLTKIIESIHKIFHGTSQKKETAESQISTLDSAAVELSQLNHIWHPPSGICTLTAVTVVTLTFPVSPWEHSPGLFTLWPHTHTRTETHA